ncbi:glutamate-1-semialdehyde 2,1-aminomutase [Marinilabiliaceae bacterium ANBcel2]|nr:glutamate-1-semialdehyde 2,1-aminomutase [Marinilabiliaceae bacterium ANBcel2]
MNNQKSKQAFLEAKKIIPGGVNSPVRAFKGVGGDPLFIEKGKGSRVWDIDGNQYVDFVASWGPLILGHAREEIVEAVQTIAATGTSFGAPTLLENKMAGLITSMVPSIDKVRMVNSGTEATMSALRLARGVTGKNKVVKFAGCFHGHGDSFLIKAGSGALTLGLPDSPGVTHSSAKDTLTAYYNDFKSIEELFSSYGDDIAAVIVEPVPGNMGVILPDEGFLEKLRDITTQAGSILIFDEVITGFRVAPGGAQDKFAVTPDITTLGKIIGGGLPVGAYGGKKEIMDHLAPEGPVYQAGTLSGNPLAMSAGIAMLTTLKKSPAIYSKIDNLASHLESGLKKALDDTGVDGVINRIGSMLTLFFTSHKEVRLNNQVSSIDTERYAQYFHGLLKRGIYIAPSAFESIFISDAHTSEDVEHMVEMSRAVFTEMSEGALS